VTKIPPGYVLISVADLAALHAARADPGPLAAPPDPKSARATMPGLAEAIGLLAARVHGIDSPGLSGDVPAPSVAAALVIIAAATLGQFLPDRGTRLLADLGVIAAREDTR
jgi:hypothetical protein